MDPRQSNMATAGSDEEAAEQSKEAELKSVRPSRSAENFSNGAFPNGETSRQQAGTWRTYSNSAYDSQLPPGEGFRGVAENEDRYYRQELPSEETPAAEANGFVREEGPDYSGEDAEMAGQGVRGASYREASSVAFSMNEEGGNGRSTPVGLYPGLVPGLPAQMFMSGFQYPFFPPPFFPSPGLQPGMGIPISWPGSSPFFNPFMQLPVQPASPPTPVQPSESSSRVPDTPEPVPEQQPSSTATQPPNPGLNPSAASWSPPSQNPPRPQPQQPQPRSPHPHQMAGETYPPDWQRPHPPPPPARGQRPPLAPQWPPTEAPQFQPPPQAFQFNGLSQAPHFGPPGQFQRPPRPHLSPAAPPFVANQQFPRGRVPGTDQRPPLVPRGPQYFTPRPQNLWFQRPQQPPPRPAPVQRALSKVDSTKLRIMSRELQSNMQTESPTSQASGSPAVATESARREVWQRRPTLEALSEEGSEVEEGQARSEEPEVDSDSTGWSGRSVTKEPSATDLVAFARADGEEPVEAEKGAQETDAEGEDEIIPSQAAACKEGETENGREPEEEDEVAEEERLSDATSSDTEADASQEAQRASDDKGDGATEPKERDSPEAAPEKETSPNGAKSLATEQPESESESDRGAKVEPGADAALEALQSVVEDTATEKTGDSPGGKALEQDSEASAGQGVGEESVRSAADREAEEATESSKRSSAQARVESTPGLAEERPREEAQNEEESSEEETRESRIEEAEASPTESKDSPEEESAAVREAEAAPKVGAERADGSESSEESDARWEGCSSRQQVETEVTLEPEEASEGSRERIEGEREADACTDGQKSVVAAAAEERGEKELEARAQLGEEKETGLERSEESKSTAEGAENDTVKPSSAQQEASDACKVKVNSSEGENAEAAAETEQENAPESSPEGPSGGGVDAVRESERQAEAAVTPGSEVESGTGGSEASQVGLADAINDQKLPAGDGNGEEPAEKTRSAAAGADVREVELKKEETAEVASLKEEKPSVLRPEAESESTLRGGIPSSVLSMLLPHFRKAEGGSSSYGKTSQDQAAKEGARQPPRFAPKLGPPPGFEMHAKRENGAASRGQESGGGEGEIDDLLKVLIGGGSGGTEEGQGGGPERQDVSRARNLEVATKVETHLGQSLEEVEVARASVVGPDFWKEMLGLAGSTGAERGSAERGSAEPERKAEDGGAAAAGREAKEAREKTWEELFDEMQAKAARGEPLQKPDSEKTWEELEADGRFVIPQKRKTVPQQPPPSEDEWRVKVGSQIGVGKSDKPGEPLARAVLQEAAKAKKAELEKVKIKAWSKPEVFAPEEPPDQSEAPRGRDSTTRAEEEYLGEAKERGRGAIDGAAGVLSTVGRERKEAEAGSGSRMFEGAIVQLQRQSSKERRSSESNQSSPERRQSRAGKLLFEDEDKGARSFPPLATSNVRGEETKAEPVKSPKTPKSGQWCEMVEQSEDDLPSLPDVLKTDDTDSQLAEKERSEEVTGRVIQTGHVPQITKASEAAEVAARANGERTAFRAAAMGAAAGTFAGLAERSKAAARLALGGAPGDRPPTGGSAHGSARSEPPGWNANRPTTGGPVLEHVQSGPSGWPGAGNAGGLVAPDDLEEDDSEAEEFARLRKLKKTGGNLPQSRPVQSPTPQPPQPVERKPKAARITAPHEIEDEEASDVEEVGRATRKGKRYSQKQFISELESGGGYYDRTWVETEQELASQNRGPPQAFGQRNFNQKQGFAPQFKGQKKGIAGRVGERFVEQEQLGEADRVSSPRQGVVRERTLNREPTGPGRRLSTPPQGQESRPLAGATLDATSSRTQTPETLPSTPSDGRAQSRASPVSLSTEASPIESVKSSLSVKSPRESLSGEDGYESATSSVFDNNDDKWSTEDQSEGPSSRMAAQIAAPASSGGGEGEVSTEEQQREAEAPEKSNESAPRDEEGGVVAAVRAAVRQLAVGKEEKEAGEGVPESGWKVAEEQEEKVEGVVAREETVEEPTEETERAEGNGAEEGNEAAVTGAKEEEKTGPLSEEELQRRTIWVGSIPEKLFTEKKLWEHFRNLGLKIMSIRLINSRTLTTRDGLRIEGAAFMCLKDEDAAMDALPLFKKDRAPFRNMLLRPRTPAVYEARGWVPGPGQFAAPPPKATKHSPPTEKGLPGRNHRGQEAAEGRAAGPQFSNRVPGSQPGRTNGSEDGLSEADEPQFWELPPTTAPVGAPAKKAQLSVRPAEPRLDEEARARARRLEKERQILADHVKFRDWEERVRQQRAEAERAEAAARRGRAKAGKKGGEKPAPRRGETNPADFDDSPPFARFFVAIGNSKEDVENSVEHSAWTSVTRTGNRKLDMAFRKLREGEGAGPLYLFLTVNASGVFCGVAEMTGRVKDEALEIWQECPWGGHFPVKWHLVVDVPGTFFEHILLTNNDRKPVTVSRDMQEVPFEQGLEMLRVFKAEAIKAAPPAPLPAPEEPNLETGRAENDFVDWDTVALPTPGDYPAETLPQRPETPVPAVPPAGVSTTQMLPRVTEVKEKAQASVSPKAPQPKDEAIIKDTQPGRARIRDTPLKWWPAAEAGKRFAEKAKGAEANGKRKDETSGKRNSGHRKRGGLFELLEVESPAASESSSDEERPRPRPPTEQETASVPVAPEEEAESSGNGAQKEWDELFLGGARAQEERLGDVPEEKREEALVERAKGLVGRLPAKGLDARDADGCTAAMHALLQGRLQLAGFLLESGARADYPTKDGLNALQVIAQTGSSELCALALARIRESGGQQGLAKAVNKPDNRGRSPLAIAAQYGWAAILDQLIASGARADEGHHPGGATALFKAAELGQVEAVSMLLVKGTNPTPPAVNGLTPLDVAKQYGHKRTAAALAAAGATGELPKRVEALCNRGLESGRTCDKKEGPGLKFRTCGRCREMRYCSKDCQVSAWPEHKLFCRERE